MNHVKSSHGRFARFAVLTALCLTACTDPKAPTEPTDDPPSNVCRVPEPDARGAGPAQWVDIGPVPIQNDDTDEEFGVPSLAVHGNSMYLAYYGRVRQEGQELLVPTNVYLMENHGSGWSTPVDISGTSWPAAFPRLNVDRDGIAHLIWGENRATSPDVRPSLITTLMYISGRNGDWSTPVTLWPGNGVDDVNRRWRLVPDSAGYLHLAFTHMPYIEATYLRKGPEGWTELSALGSPGRRPGDVDFAAAGDSLLLTTFIGAGAFGDPNAVFFRYSADHGESMSEQFRVSAVGPERAYYPRVIAGADGRYHVIWITDIDGDYFPDIVEHSHSVDGECWSDPVRVAASLTGLPVDHEIVADDAGGLHLVYQLMPSAFGYGETSLVYVYWNGREWMEPVVMYRGSSSGGEWVRSFSLSRDGVDPLHMVIDAKLDDQLVFRYLQGHPTPTP